MFFQLLLNGLSLRAVYSLIAVGFALIFNILKFSNFAHGGLMTVAAYTGFLAVQYLHTGFIGTLATAIAAGGLLGLIAELVAFRRIRKKQGQVIYYFVSSITLGILFENLMTIFFSTNFYSYPNFLIVSSISLLGAVVSVSDLMMFVLSLLALVVLGYVIYHTRLGTAIRAVSFDVNTASLMGINVDRILQWTFFISGGLGGLSGVFLGINYTLYPQLGQLIVKGFIASVIGGLGSLPGAVIGAFLLGLVEILLTNWVGSGISPVFLFFLMLAFLLLRPRGIAGIQIQEKV